MPVKRQSKKGVRKTSVRSKKKKKITKQLPKQSKLPRQLFFVLLLIIACGIIIILGKKAFTEKKVKQHAQIQTVIKSIQSKKNKSLYNINKRIKNFSSAETNVSSVTIIKNHTKDAENYIVFEENRTDFALQLQNIDAILLKTLVDTKEKKEHFRILELYYRLHKGNKFLFQKINVDNIGNENKILQLLRQRLVGSVPQAVLKKLNSTDFVISIMGTITHQIHLNTSFLPVAKSTFLIPTFPNISTAKKPRLVVVIDDLGMSLRDATRLSKLSFPVTFAILPNTVRAREVAEFAHIAGEEILVHMPTEPIGYPHRANPGENALLVRMDSKTLRQKIRLNLNKIPYAVGVNNHMGSRFTQDSVKMDILMQELKSAHLFFLDSKTIASTVGMKVALSEKVDYLQRDIFIDNVQNQDVILLQLKKAEILAKKKGFAIVIGHPYSETLDALEKWQIDRAKYVDIVTLKTILY